MKLIFKNDTLIIDGENQKLKYTSDKLSESRIDLILDTVGISEVKGFNNIHITNFNVDFND